MNLYNHVDTGQLPPPWEYPDDPAVLAKFELRRHAADEIERLISFLDDLDGDPDLEPYLAQNGACLGVDDRESDADEDVVGSWHHATDDDEDGGDREADPAELGIGDLEGLGEQGDRGVAGGYEPDLGATEELNHDRAWAGPDAAAGWICHDGEPSLGWTAVEAAYGCHSEPSRLDQEDDGDDRECRKAGIPLRRHAPQSLIDVPEIRTPQRV